MRVTGAVTSVSWIPSDAVTGAVLRMPFKVGLAHYDDPPPDVVDDLDAFLAADQARFANRLEAWVEVHDGAVVDFGHQGHGRIGSTTLRLGHFDASFAAVSLPDRQRAERVDVSSVRFEQTAGGRTGVPAPRRVSHPPYVQLAAPLAWTTLRLTLHADGRQEAELVGASPFPRHWVYDHGGGWSASRRSWTTGTGARTPSAPTRHGVTRTPRSTSPRPRPRSSGRCR